MRDVRQTSLPSLLTDVRRAARGNPTATSGELESYVGGRTAGDSPFGLLRRTVGGQIRSPEAVSAGHRARMSRRGHRTTAPAAPAADKCFAGTVVRDIDLS